MSEKSKAVVLHSGGQDSTTCLAWALQEFDEVQVVSFDYGQRHKVELGCARDIAGHLGLDFKVIPVPLFKDITTNALLDSSKELTPGDAENLPSSFVDGRNLVFLTTAAIYAKGLGVSDLVTGVCQTDYSGYPDCREEFVKSAQETLRLAMEFDFTIHTPLMHKTKAEIVLMMKEMGQLELLKYSHTCYEGQRPACGKCPACKLRLKGFEEAGEVDLIDYTS